jgi:lipoyl(octanoyl) transferase
LIALILLTILGPRGYGLGARSVPPRLELGEHDGVLAVRGARRRRPEEAMTTIIGLVRPVDGVYGQGEPRAPIVASESKEVIGMRGDLPIGLPAAGSHPPVEWRVSSRVVPYPVAVEVMTTRAAAIAAGRARELVWLIEHPPLYTGGTSARPEDLIEPRFPVFTAGRGGQFTYHGPGQRIAYVMLDLKRRTPDLRRFVATLEEWIIRALRTFGVNGERREDRVGVWVPLDADQREDKIAAIGIRVRHFVTLHGISLNVDPDLEHFNGIVPCGVSDPRHGTTSLAKLGCAVTISEADVALRREFEPLFGKTDSRPGDPPELGLTVGTAAR